MNEFSSLCARCKGKGLCGKPCKILAKFPQVTLKKTHFSGSSPPEIFIGRENYPLVNTGILSPDEYGETEEFSLPELWHEKNFSIEDILSLRSKMIYARFKSRITDARNKKKFTEIMQEISLASSPVSTEFFLKKPPTININISMHTPIIGNPAPLLKARLEENPKIEKKAEYLASDTDIKAREAILELYKSKIQVSNIIKILSAGLLGKATARKLVPTRWAITATDDSISKFLLEKIKFYQEISGFQLFHSYYLGNHYEFLLLPDEFSFEVLEAKMSGSVWNPVGPLYLAQDFEGFSGRKSYASSVTGAYYVNRLALCEYLSRIQKQASCLVMRECRPEYYAPCGVGILREASRAAFQNKPETFSSLQEALQKSQERLKLNISTFTNQSQILREYKKQTRLNKWL